MIKVKVTKNIIRKNEVAFGLNRAQVIVAAVGLAIGMLEIYLLKGITTTDTRMTIVFFSMAAFIFGGIVQINGTSLMSTLTKSLKGVDKRPYNKEGVYNDENKPTENQ